MISAYRRGTLLCALVGLALARPATSLAQSGFPRTLTPETGIAISRLSQPLRPEAVDSRGSSLTLSASEVRDNGYKGLAIGGAALGLGGGLMAHALCSRYSSEPNNSCTGETVIGAAIGAAIGAGLGYLIGKRSKRPA